MTNLSLPTWHFLLQTAPLSPVRKAPRSFCRGSCSEPGPIANLITCIWVEKLHEKREQEMHSTQKTAKRVAGTHSDCGLARLVRVCLRQSRPSALRPNVVNPFSYFVVCLNFDRQIVLMAYMQSPITGPEFSCLRLPGFSSQRCILDLLTMIVFQSRCLKRKTWSL